MQSAQILRALAISLFLIETSGANAQKIDERGNTSLQKRDLRRLHAGAEISATAHNEEGLDKSKGEYSVSYGTVGGSLLLRYDFTDWFLQGGLGLMRLTSLTVNSVKIEMQGRVQWHVPFYAHLYFKVLPILNMGLGVTHLTETTMYVQSVPAPESSYNQIFADGALQVAPPLTENLTLTVTAVLGLNLIPGRQHTYSVGDLLHLRLQINVGVLYAIL